MTSKNINNLLFILFLCVTVAASGKNKPTGLLTDLLEHTDRVYLDGYPSTLHLEQLQETTEGFQTVEIASEKPTFSWIVPGERQGTRQISYRIILSSSREDAERREGSVWDSGEVMSAQSTSVNYTGSPLQPAKVYYWRVQSTTTGRDEAGEWSDIKAFRTAPALSVYKQAGYPLEKATEYPGIQSNPTPQVTVVDFGKASFGQLKLTLRSEKENDTVIVHLGEQSKDGRVNRNPAGTVRYQRYALPLKQGIHTYRIKIRKDKRNTGSAAILMPEYIGEVMPFRYCEIEGHTGNLEAESIQRESVYYPFNDYAAEFRSSDDILNQVWELCKYSVKATSFAGIYIDGDRERIPYEADALINQLCHYSVDREYTLARRSHEYLLDHPTWPTEWILQAILIAWYDYLYTGDTRSLQAHYDILQKRTLIERREQNGLISTTLAPQTPEFLQGIRMKNNIRDIVDWPHTGILGLNKAEGGEADGFVFTDYNAVVNAYHYETLRLMSLIAKALDKHEDHHSYAEQARIFREKYNNAFLDTRKGYYKDGISTDHSSLHANMFALAFGLVNDKHKETTLDFIRSRRMACSVYGAQFLMDALYEAYDAEYALSLLTDTTDRSWYNMIRVGSTISLEAWDDKYKPNQDWNHAWGAVPANIIPRKLMGIEPLEAGYGLVRIRPQLGSLEQAEVKLPTIKGSIHLSIENKLTSDAKSYAMQLQLPANLSSEVYMPLPPFTGYKVTQNGQEVKVKRIKGTPFLYLGVLTGGKYELKIIKH